MALSACPPSPLSWPPLCRPGLQRPGASRWPKKQARTTRAGTSPQHRASHFGPFDFRSWPCTWPPPGSLLRQKRSRITQPLSLCPSSLAAFWSWSSLPPRGCRAAAKKEREKKAKHRRHTGGPGRVPSSHPLTLLPFASSVSTSFCSMCLLCPCNPQHTQTISISLAAVVQPLIRWYDGMIAHTGLWLSEMHAACDRRATDGRQPSSEEKGDPCTTRRTARARHSPARRALPLPVCLARALYQNTTLGTHDASPPPDPRPHTRGPR